MASVLKVDKLDPQSGTALEIGTSGDTVSIPSGATLDISASTLTPPATMPASSGVNLTALNASNLGSGTVPAARLSGLGKVLQVQQYLAQSRTTGSGTSYADNGVLDTITCAATDSKVLVIVNYDFQADNANAAVTQTNIKQKLLRSDDGFASDSNMIFVTNNYSNFPENSGMDFMIAGQTTMVVLDSPSSTSELTYKTQTKGVDATQLWEIASYDGVDYFSRGITLIEIGA